jgi:hypothetical protein
VDTELHAPERYDTRRAGSTSRTVLGSLVTIVAA